MNVLSTDVTRKPLGVRTGPARRTLGLFDQPVVQRHAALRKGLAAGMALQGRILATLVGPDAYAKRPTCVMNALPYSGSHFLLQAARAMPGLRYRGGFVAQLPAWSLKQRTDEDVARRIQRILPGEVIGAHVFPTATTMRAFDRINALHVFVYRDPRAVLVSELHFLTLMAKNHRMHRQFARLPRFSDRLALALDGVDARYPDAVSRMMHYAGCLSDPATLALRFEDIVGSQKQRHLAQLAHALARRGGVALGQAGTLRLTDTAAPSCAVMGRHDVAEGWRKGLSTRQQDMLTERLRPLLIAFGYREGDAA